MQQSFKPKNIKQWAEEDRPREKMLTKGKSSLTKSELLAIIIGSGNNDESAVELSKRILETVGNNFNQLGRLTIADLTKFKGIGEAKAISIVAALEIGRRRQKEAALKKPEILFSKDAFELLAPHIADLNHEEFWLILLNNAKKLIGYERICMGNINITASDVKMVFKKAIDGLANNIIIAHNHPSGNLTPSNADKVLTQKYKEAAKIFDIHLVDHIIVANQTYFSFADNNLL